MNQISMFILLGLLFIIIYTESSKGLTAVLKRIFQFFAIIYMAYLAKEKINNQNAPKMIIEDKLININNQNTAKAIIENKSSRNEENTEEKFPVVTSLIIRYIRYSEDMYNVIVDINRSYLSKDNTSADNIYSATLDDQKYFLFVKNTNYISNNNYKYVYKVCNQKEFERYIGGPVRYGEQYYFLSRKTTEHYRLDRLHYLPNNIYPPFKRDEYCQCFQLTQVSKEDFPGYC